MLAFGWCSEMKKIQFFMGKKFKLLFSFLGAVIFLIVLYFTAGIWFETNDDLLIGEMLSGKIIGEPEWHCPYVGPLLTIPLSALYRVFPEIPWWGILIFACLLFVIFIVIFLSMSLAESLTQMVGFSLAAVLLVIVGIHNFGQAQFTSAAILLAFSGYIILITYIDSRPAWVAFAILELLAVSIRDSSMLLVQPIGVMALMGMNFIRKPLKDNLKNLVKKTFCCVVLVVVIILVTKIANRLTFSSEEWKDYYKFNDCQMYLLDYEPAIPYEDLSDILAKYGITSEEYEQINQYRTWYLDNKFTGACLEELLPRLSEIRRVKVSGGTLTEAVKQLLFTSTEFWHLHQLTAILFATVGLAALISGGYRMLIPILSTFMGYFVGIVFLAYRNRFALRVMMPYYFGTMLVLCIILFYIVKDVEWGCIRGRISISILTVVALGLALTFLQTGRVQFAYIRAQNHVVNSTYCSEKREIMDYCNARPNKHYVLDMSYARFVSSDIFEYKYYGKTNYIYSGSWYSNTPNMLEYSKDYIADGCYYIVYETQKFYGLDGLDYYTKMFGTEPVIEDKFKLSSGATIWVWKVAPPE